MNLTRAALLLLSATCIMVARSDDKAALARATALYQEAEAFTAQDRRSTGLGQAKEALAIREALLGLDAEEVGWSLLQVFNAQGGKEVALRPLLERAEAIFKAKGTLSGQGTAARYLALSYISQDMAIAAQWADRSLELRRACGDRIGEADSLTFRAHISYWQRQLPVARSRYLEALALQETLGLEKEMATTLTFLASISRVQGDPAGALAMVNQAILHAQRAGNRWREAQAMLTLVILKVDQGEVLSSVPTLERALATFQSYSDLYREADVEKRLGRCYRLLGEPAKALGFYERSRDHNLAMGYLAEAATVWTDIGLLDLSLGKIPEGVKAVEQSLALLGQVNNPSMAGYARTTLAQLYLADGRLEAARTCLDQALALERANQNKTNEAETLLILGRILARQGRAAEAIAPCEQALAFQQSVGDVYAQVAVLSDLARRLHEVGRLRESSARYAEAVALQERLRETYFPALTEARKLTLSLTFEATRFDFIAHACSPGLKDAGTTQACFDAWLAHKGAVLDAQERIQEAILQSPEPQVRDLAQSLTRTRLDLAVLTQSKPSGLSMADYQARLEALQTQRTRQEEQLAGLSRRFASGTAGRRLDGAALAKRLPAGSAYLDFARIRAPRFDPENTDTSRYAVFLLRAGEPLPVLVDLGPAELVDARIQALREAMAAGRPVQEDLAALHRLILQPLESRLSGATSFIVSPSGALNLVPFELLGPSNGQPLMDRGPVSYVTSGRDLARFTALGRPKGALAILANPDFDFGLSKGARADQAPRAFPVLPGTHQEGLAIARAFPQRDVLRLEGASATEASLLAVKAPWALHLATHGYTLASAEPTWTRDQLDSGLALPGLRNPMTRTGLALAGANLAMAGQGGQGLFSADKVLGLDLSGTSLVVLSACNTGLGTIQDAEGVFGLRRAFMLAGAQTLVVSLWPVPDADTRKLMGLFYRGLARGLSKGEALLQAKRHMRTLSPHPRDWAGFVLVGNPS